MAKTSFKVVIPMAGRGARLRPQTWSKPKQLVNVAGKAVLDYVLDSLVSLPGYPKHVELINIVGYLGEQIENYVRDYHHGLKSRYVEQQQPRGQSDAIKLVKQYLDGPILVVFADTLITTDLSFLETEKADAVIWVKPVDDPRRFGVATINPDGWVTRLIEKPQDMSNGLAVVGFYYFNDAKALLSAIDRQIEQNIQINGEFYLADAINIMLDCGLRMRTQLVDVWQDAGTPEALLETNRYLLNHGRDNSEEAMKRQNVVIIPPVYIYPTARIEESIIGPNVSVGASCHVKRSVIRDSILEEDADIAGVTLKDSLIGRSAFVHRSEGIVNAGDDTEITL
jgi:glucose-1-phosphate thymidylyltransferase